MSFSHAKNVCQSQNNMQPFFLYIQVNNNIFLLFPIAALLIIDNPSNFQDLLSFLKCILIPFKKVSQVTELDVCHSHNYIQPFFSISSY